MKDVLATGEASSPRTRTSSTLKHTIYSTLSFWRIIFTLMDPHPADKTQCGSVRIRNCAQQTLIRYWIGCCLSNSVLEGILQVPTRFGLRKNRFLSGSAPCLQTVFWRTQVGTSPYPIGISMVPYPALFRSNKILHLNNWYSKGEHINARCFYLPSTKSLKHFTAALPYLCIVCKTITGIDYLVFLNLNPLICIP